MKFIQNNNITKVHDAREIMSKIRETLGFMPITVERVPDAIDMICINDKYYINYDVMIFTGGERGLDIYESPLKDYQFRYLLNGAETCTNKMSMKIFNALKKHYDE